VFVYLIVTVGRSQDRGLASPSERVCEHVFKYPMGRSLAQGVQPSISFRNPEHGQDEINRT